MPNNVENTAEIIVTLVYILVKGDTKQNYMKAPEPDMNFLRQHTWTQKLDMGCSNTDLQETI